MVLCSERAGRKVPCVMSKGDFMKHIAHVRLDEYTQVALKRCFIPLQTVIKMVPFRGRAITYVPQSGNAKVKGF